MAGQAHYTSAPPSAADRHGGFRFAAVSPAARPALGVLRPLTGYTPPPGAVQPAACPVAFAYDRPDDDTAVLTRTRFTGRDYTGRLGNHFCHALCAGPGELAGLRPVELWDTPHWAPSPAPDDGQALPDLAELVPGSAVGPDRVRRLLDATGDTGIRLLERLLTVTLRALAGEGTGATLVSADPERVVDWIAAVSYTLPAGLTARLTFTTYTARPEDDHRHLTGTRPETGERAPAPVFDLDGLREDAGPEPCATARFLAGAWGSGRLDLVDAVADLWEAAPDEGAGTAAVRRLRAACALLAPDGTAGPAVAEDSGLAGFVQAVAELRPQAAGVPPERVRDAAERHLAALTAPLGDVRAALAPLPEPYRGAVLAGLLTALEAAAESRAEVLDAQACAFLASLADGAPGGAQDVLAEAPGTALHVLRRATEEPRRAGLRILRLYRRGLWQETETYEALHDLVRAEEPEPERQQGPRLPWRRGSAREKE
ncbi:GAP1-N2 domain-containing protein [Streptomyces sp. NPDC001393]